MEPREETTRSQHSFRTTLLIVALALFLAACAGGEQGSSPPQETTLAGGEGTVEEQETGGRAEQLELRDAVGQMFVMGVGGTGPDPHVEALVRERNIGGVLLLGHNMESEEQTRELAGSLQEMAVRAEPAIPLLVAVDHEGGEVQHAPWVAAQPSAAEVGGRGDPEEARRIAESVARELRRGGINTNLAPVVDTGGGAAIGGRSYGGNPALVGNMGAAAVEGFARSGVVSAAKHFPNHGPALEDSHVSLPRVEHDLARILSEDLPPFRAAVEAGAPIIMTGHLVYPALDPERPASLSPAATELLRGELGFGGVILTDDLAMEGATRGANSIAGAAVEAVLAGADLLLISGPPEAQTEAHDAVLAAARSGEVPLERINASVERILNLKKRYPLYRER